MTQVIKYYCNKKGCRQERGGSRSLHIFSHSTPDASGNGSEHWQAVADFCPEHLLQFTQFLVGLIEDKRLPKNLKEVYEKFDVSFELV